MYQLEITREVELPPEKLFKAWTLHMREWWAPKPLTTPVCEIEPVAGGRLHTVMRTPTGEDLDTEGVFLEVVENRKIVFTDAYHAGWVPSGAPFFTAIITFDPLPAGGTFYSARVVHWREEDMRQHEDMGFREGWSTCLDQLVEVALTL